MTIFTLLALGVTNGVIQARRLAQLNVMRTSAYTVAQGYMEQILSLNPADIEAASEPWVSVRPALPTESVNALVTNTTNIEISDPLYVSPVATIPSGSNLTARTDLGITNDVWNNKTIMIDIATSTSGNQTPIIMNEQLDVFVSRAWTQVGGAWQVPQSPTNPAYFLVRIDFQFRSNGYLAVNWLKGTIRMARTDITGP